MRFASRIGSLLVVAVMLVGGVAPSASVFRCWRMDGQLRAHACCPDADDDGTAVASPCCERLNTPELHTATLAPTGSDRTLAPLQRATIAYHTHPASPPAVTAFRRARFDERPHDERRQRRGTILRV